MAWKNEDTMDKKSFVGNVQCLCDKTATSLKSTALVAYHVHPFIIINFTYSFQKCLVESDHTVLKYLPVKGYGAKKIVLVLSETEGSTRYCSRQTKRFRGRRAVM